MWTCKWKPSRFLWGADRYEGCPHEPRGNSDYCIFHIPLEQKREKPELAEELTKAFDSFFDDKILKDEAGDFRGFIFPDGINLFSIDFRRSDERDNPDAGLPDDHKPASFQWAKFGYQAYFREANFGDHANFRNAEFGDRADFRAAKFGDQAYFREANFGGQANFQKVNFGDQAHFREANFGDHTNFSEANFGDEANFSKANFGDQAHFLGAKFGYRACFIQANFGDQANFLGPKFGDQAIFQRVDFGDQADFSGAKFGDQADFSGAKFGDQADFSGAKFGDQADFGVANFGDQADFWVAKFGDQADFRKAKFGDQADFSGAKFIGLSNFAKVQASETAFLFSDARLEDGGDLDGVLKKPSSSRHLFFRETAFNGPAIFHNVDLSRVRFEMVDLQNLSFFKSKISQTEFVSCQWGSGPESRKHWHRTGGPIFRFKRPRLLLDELLWRKKNRKKRSPVPLLLRPFAGFWKFITYIKPKGEVIDTMEPPEDLQAEDIEILGLQLKQSLEATKDPITAGDFHFCVMEMKLEKARAAGRWARALGLTLYKLINGYGERYARTLMWLALLVAVSTLLFAWQGGALFEDYESFGARLEPAFFWACQHILPFKFGTELWTIDVKDSAMRWLTMGETFIGSTLFTFMILAMRRRFKR